MNKVQKLIRLAGNPWKITASELIIALVLVAAGAILLSTQIQNARVEFTLACFLLIAMPFTRLNKLKNKRQLEARTAIRFLKRRLNTQLKMGIPLDQALEEISSYAPGEFGSVFNDAVSQLTGQNRRSLKEVMQDLRLQYEVKELDSFCLSLELSDMKTMTILREQLDRQISEEAHRIDEFIEERSENVKPKLLSLATLTFLFSVSLAGYFVFAYLNKIGTQVVGSSLVYKGAFMTTLRRYLKLSIWISLFLA